MVSSANCITLHDNALHFKQWSVEHIVEAFGRTPLITDPLSSHLFMSQIITQTNAMVMMMFDFDRPQKNI